MSRELTIAAYAAVGVVALLAELVALTRPRLLHRVGDIVTWALRRRSAQFGLLLVWWWLGWHWVTQR